MAQKELKIVKKAEKDAQNIIIDSQKKAETIVKRAKVKGERTKKQALSTYKEEMKVKRNEADVQIKTEVEGIREQGTKDAEAIKTQSSSRLENSVVHIVSRVIGV